VKARAEGPCAPFLAAIAAALAAALAASPAAAAVDSYRFLHVTIDTPWYLFLFLLLGVLAPFVLLAVLMWKHSLRAADLRAQEEEARSRSQAPPPPGP